MYAQAAETLKEVIDLKDENGALRYDLYPLYRELFLPQNENNCEVIFDIQYMKNAYSQGLSHQLYTFTYEWNSYCPTASLAECYYTKNGYPVSWDAETQLYKSADPAFDPTYPYKDRDPRLDQSIIMPGTDNGRGTIFLPSSSNHTGMKIRKWNDYTETEKNNSEHNIILIRFADVLLMRADAAFEGLMDMLPDTDWSEPLLSLFFGVFAGWILYSRGVGLKYAEKNGKEAKSFHGFSAITVNILLGTVCLIYAVYLLSQLAYLGGGFAGILPDGYTLAEYARRGFFEMAWLSFINLGLMCLAMGLVEKKAGAPALTRGLCLFLGLAALFLIAAASAKMLLYIGGYGLTRKRVLTEVFMLWLGVTTILVSVWLFKPRFPYMKGAVICALILGCVTFWADVDTQVARYNVRAYQSGQLETIDMGHMGCLGDGALPYIKELTHDRAPEIASTAMDILENSYCSISDFRSWTYTESAARKAVDAD